MKKKPIIYTLLLGFFLATFSGCFLSDPRKNCNHPDHGRYMAEKIKKRQGF